MVKTARKAPIIDGKLDDAAWQDVKRLDLNLYDYAGSKPQAGSSVMLVRDKDNLYIAFECAEPAVDKIVKKVTERDGPVYMDDCIQIFIAPFKEPSNYRYFICNSIGTQFDADKNIPGFSYGDNSWRGSWRGKSSIESKRWICEVAIPFADLGGITCKPWRINFTRERRAGKRENSTWAPIVGQFHQPDMFGELHFE